MFDTRAITFGCENADIMNVVENAPTKPNNHSITMRVEGIAEC